MLVSVVIPAFNAATFLSRTVHSVIAQTFTDWECIIVDDGSTDDTFAVAASLARLDSRIRTVHQINAGVAGARNRGLHETDAASEYIIFLDHDDEWTADCLAVLTAALATDSVAPACHGLAEAWRAEGLDGGTGDIRNRRRRKVERGRVVDVHPSEPTTRAMLLWDNCITTAGCALFRRSSLARLGTVFDPLMAPLDDWDVYFRAASLAPFVFVDSVVIRWHVHGANSSNNRAAMNAATCRVRRRMLSDGALDSAETQIVRKRLDRMLRTSARHRAEDGILEFRREMARGATLPATRHLGRAIREYSTYLWGIGPDIPHA